MGTLAESPTYHLHKYAERLCLPTASNFRFSLCGGKMWTWTRTVLSSTVGVQLLCQIRAYTAPFELYRRTGRKDAYSSVVVSGCDVAGFKLRRSLLDRAQGENLGSFYPKLKFLYFNDHFTILNFFTSSRKENQNYGNRIPSLSTSSTSRESREKRR